MQSIIRPGPSILTIFGGSGDLVWRKLMPALYDLFMDGWLPEHFAIVGADIKDLSLKQYHDHLHEGIRKFARHRKAEGKKWKEFSKAVSYVAMDLMKKNSYTGLGNILKELRQKIGSQSCNLYYMAVPPQFVQPIAKLLKESGITGNAKNTRIVVEKPFGHDYESAHRLNSFLLTQFSEKSIYRIDHYLGKETIQNIMALRFANTLFEPIWNRNYIEHVQITVSEDIGVEHRGAYYEKSGALRDMVQNHLLQLVCLVAMEPPVRFTADEVRNKKIDVLNAVRILEPNEVFQNAVRGQYGPGWIRGKKMKGYRAAPHVAPDSGIETFVALKLFVDNWRWQNVPFYLRTGKRMAETLSLIAVQFRPVPHKSFPPESTENWQANRLIVYDKPQKGISLQFQAKLPGLKMILNPVEMLFNYSSAYKEQTPETYETLLLDVMLGDATLFMRDDQIEAAWKVVDPILKAWDSSSILDFPNYHSGQWGPEEAEALIAKDGHNWVSQIFDHQDFGKDKNEGDKGV
jgi:glucose-6-phosphate 1-dehydrogenase